ncbi:epidermal growth factor receptor substrate 15-like 1 [Saccostrea cucullata]|uniref:epidermal growth factor receptor substrate 15-like 1 n=1 Tax=Saccostrea cuccullata TaxID=36930 RepID=UPI002ED55ED2
MEQQVEVGKQQLELLVKSQNDLQLQISQTRQRVQHLNDQERGLKHSIASYSSVNSEVSNIFSNQLQDDLSTRATYGSPVSTISNFSAGSALDDFKEDPFKSKDVFGGDTGGGGSDPFQSDDPFKESGDPFKSSFGSDPFSSDDPFKSSDTFESSSKSGKEDPFNSVDPFASFGGTDNSKLDAFDPFGKGGSSSKPSKPGNLFGGDPFAPKSPSRPPLGPKSPAPALPPNRKSSLPQDLPLPKTDPPPAPVNSWGDLTVIHLQVMTLSPAPQEKTLLPQRMLLPTLQTLVQASLMIKEPGVEKSKVKRQCLHEGPRDRDDDKD